ncbi:hypothetical protein BGX34_010042 [Mortierella sp. NVP85]|nr:hypothetical protein BGX34_010042 [Mortierella sp. NVP85]
MKPNSNKRSTTGEWSNGGEGSSKRVRFTRGEEEPLEDVDDSELLEKRKARRGGVTVVEYDGEESSDDEEFKKKKEKTFVDDAPDVPMPTVTEQEDRDEEEDMFADPEEVEKRKAEKRRKAASKGKGKGKSKGFDRSEIEGEDLNLDDLDEVEFDSEGNPKIEAFNMKEELEEGGEIDEAGNFIRKLDPDRFHDSWLEGVSRKDIQAAQRAHERKAKQALAEEREARANAMSETDIYVELVNIMNPAETVIGALQRLGGGKKAGAKAKNKKKSWQKNAMDQEDHGSTAAPESEEEIQRRKTIEKLTDLSDKMMAMGHFEIYEESYEQIVRKLRRADIIPDDWEVGTRVLKPGEEAENLLEDDTLLSTSASWEYKWANPPEGQSPDEIYGPFSGAEMKSWNEQGFFSQGILVRMVGDSTFEPGDSVKF